MVSCAERQLQPYNIRWMCSVFGCEYALWKYTMYNSSSIQNSSSFKQQQQHLSLLDRTLVTLYVVKAFEHTQLIILLPLREFWRLNDNTWCLWTTTATSSTMPDVSPVIIIVRSNLFVYDRSIIIIIIMIVIFGDRNKLYRYSGFHHHHHF